MIKKVTQNNTGMYTEESSQKTIKIPNSTLMWDLKCLQKLQQWHTIDQKGEQDKPQCMMLHSKVSKRDNSDAQDTFWPMSDFFSCAVILHVIKYFYITPGIIGVLFFINPVYIYQT